MEKAPHLRPVRDGEKGVESAQLPRQLEPVRRLVVDRFADYLAGMLDRADDRLFDMAENASDAEQARYFDTMRELRLQRSGIESGFRQEMENRFRALAVLDSADREAESSVTDQEVDIEHLSLVDEDELEADVALENMGRRARGECHEALGLFNYRVEYLFESRFEVTEKNSPLDPLQVAGCFQANLGKLELNMQDRLILMKLFERGVLVELPGVVDEANTSLIRAGVLPDMKKPPRRPEAESEAEPPPEEDDPVPGQADQGNEENPPVFGMLQNLLSGMRGGAGGDGSSNGPSNALAQRVGPTPENIAVMHEGVPYVNGTPAEPDAVIPVPSQDLNSMLNRLQSLEQQLRETDGKLEDLNVKQELSGLLQEEYGKESVHALEESDDDAINLVAMLFDFILDDDALPAEVRALIGRLQIPLLRVAIADKTFFNDDQHPARELLNLLARAGSQWSPEQGMNDELYKSIEESVYRILNEFDTDAGLFKELLRGMEQFLDQQEHRRNRVEERVREQEEGKAQAAEAEQRVEEIVQKRMAGRDLPEVVVRIIRDAWQQVLYLTWIREGEDSDLWKKRLRMLDALVWSVLPHRDEQNLKKLKDLSPKLLSGLKHGLEAVNHDPVETRKLLVTLRDEHRNLLRGLEIQRVHVEAPREDQSEEVGQAEALPADHPRVKEAAELQPGQWLEIGLGEGARRCKLAANIRHGDKLVFINRRGLKVVEHTAQSLGLALEQGVARLIDQGALFDRALESVIGDLRREQEKTAQ
jgi:hypothetical protein